MEYIVIIGILLILLLILYFTLEISIKKLKEIAKDTEYKKITDKFPKNIDICKDILKHLENPNVEIEEDKESTTSLYIVLSNKIIIGEKVNIFTRIQTIAHECVHSIQSKKMLFFNYIYSNIYIIYFALVSILTIFGVIKNTMLQVEILTILGVIYYFIRSMLETEAIIKSRFVAKDYMERAKICKNEEVEEIIKQYDNVNKMGVKFYNLGLLFNVIVKIIIYCVICIVLNII